MTAILLAFASAVFFGAGVVITQFGLRHVHPLSGAAISIPTFTAFFVLVSPLLLRGDHIVWRAIPIFAAIGVVYPGLLTLLTFASNRALGPVVTSALGNVSPLFSVVLAVLVLNEPLQPLQFGGIIIAVVGVFMITVTRTGDARDWRSWLLLLPLSAALMRGIMPPFIKIGLEIWPNPVAAGLIGYLFSSLTVLTVERVRNGSFIVKAARRAAMVRHQRPGQRHRHAAAVCRGGRRTCERGGPADRNLSPDHVGLERACAYECEDHSEARMRHRTGRCRRRADSDWIICEVADYAEADPPYLLLSRQLRQFTEP